MPKPLKIGILRETKIPPDNRTPLPPAQCRQAMEMFPGMKIVVQSSQGRCFSDQSYIDEGITVTHNVDDCDILMGVKEVDPMQLLAGKTYFFFSHTIKKQNHNKLLLRKILDLGIRLIDYELLTDRQGIRIIGFGRWAGLVGTYNGIRAYCLKNHVCVMHRPEECLGLEEMIRESSAVHLPPLRIAVTGDGRVSGGSEEMLQAFGISRVRVDEYLQVPFFQKPVYVLLGPAQYHTAINGQGFNLTDFFVHPKHYYGTFHRFCQNTNMLINATYWNPQSPLLFSPEQMKDELFSIRVIADITCDLKGSVPCTLRTSTFREPYYDCNRLTLQEERAFSNPDNITVMAIDNLPCGLPMEASRDFGRDLLERVFPLWVTEDKEQVIARATIANKGTLTPGYRYLEPWVYGSDD
jgi:hypothetical protein